MRIITIIISFLSAIICESSVGAGFEEKAVIINPEKASGLYRPYPVWSSDSLSSPPSGYRPFYISHYGRHGSRWLTSRHEYDIVLSPFEKANSAGSLTTKGRKVYDMVRLASDNAKGKEGCLAPIGFQQHRGIAERMASNYPDIFANDARIDARSTLTVRCVMSMDAFCRRLTELNPHITFDMESSPLTTSILGHIYGVENPIDPGYIDYGKHGEYLKISESLIHDKMQSADFIASLFSKNPFDSEKSELKFIYYLFYLICDQQNVLPENNMWDIYTPQQLYWMAVAENFRCYAKRGPYPEGEKWTMGYAVPLLEDIVERCESAVNGNGKAADLRFGHDSVIMGLAPLMGINGYDLVSDNPEEVFKKWNLSEITPMGANLQMVFYRPLDKSKSDILVKILFNEREASLPLKTSQWPYYRWEDVKTLFNNKITKYKIIQENATSY